MAINKKATESPWLAFLIGAIIVLAVVILLLLFYGKIKIGGENVIAGIGEKLGQMFK